MIAQEVDDFEAAWKRAAPASKQPEPSGRQSAVDDSSDFAAAWERASPKFSQGPNSDSKSPPKMSDRPSVMRSLDLGQTLKGIGQGALHGAQSIVAGIPGTIEAIQRAAESGGEFSDLASTGYGTPGPYGQLRDELAPAPMQPAASESEAAGRFLGGVVPWAAAGAVAPAALVPLAATTTLGEKYAELTQGGMDPQQALAIAGAHGATDAALFAIMPAYGKVIERRLGAPFVQEAAKAMATGGAFGAAQIVHNAIEKGTTDPELEALTGVGGAVGQGILLHTVMAMLGHAVAQVAKPGEPNASQADQGPLPAREGESLGALPEVPQASAGDAAPVVGGEAVGVDAKPVEASGVAAPLEGGRAPGGDASAGELASSEVRAGAQGPEVRPATEGQNQPDLAQPERVAGDVGGRDATAPEVEPALAPALRSDELTFQQQNYLRDRRKVGPGDPSFERGTSIVGVPPERLREVEQTDLSEILPAGAKVFHETNLEGADALLGRTEKLTAGSLSGLEVSDNPDLALGQGGKGVLLEIDPKRVNGSKNKLKPSLGFTESQGLGTEYKIDRFARGPVTALTIKNRATFEAARKRFGSKFDFDNPTQTERGMRVERLVGRKAELRARIDANLAKLGKNTTASINLDPDKLKTVIELAVDHIELGVISFKDWADDLMAKTGPHIRPYLRPAWRAALKQSKAPTAGSPPGATPHAPAVAATSTPGSHAAPLAAPTAPPVLVAPGGRFNIPDPSSLDQLRVKFEDAFRRGRVVQKAVEKQGGNVPEEANLSVRQDLFTSRTSERIEKLRTGSLDAAARIAKIAKIELETGTPDSPSIGEYISARGAAQRNATIAARSPGTVAGSGMTDARAQQILDAVNVSPKRAAYERIGKISDRVSDEALDRRVTYGLSTPSEIAQWRADFGPHYAPHKTITEPSDSFQPSGRSFQVKGKETHRAEGRNTMASNPFIAQLQQAEEIVNRGERNRVGQSLGELVERNPDADLWQTYDVPNDVPVADRGSVFEWKKDGSPKYTVIKDPALSDALKGISATNSHEWMNAIGKAARFYKQLHTTYNLAFPASNLQRDLGTMGINMTAHESRSFALGALKRVPGMIRDGWRVTRDPNATGGNADSIREQREAGGRINWVEPQTFEKKAKQFEALFKEGSVKQSAKALVDIVEAIGDAVENGTRGSVYAEARARGMTPERAAHLALHSTTPFTRRGQLGPTINALWLFSGAQIQGNVNVARTLRTSKGLKIAGGLAAAGFLMSKLNRYAGGTDDNTGMRYWDQYSDYDKGRYFRVIVPGTGGKTVGFLLPWGFNVFYHMGVIVEEMTAGKTSPVQASGKLAASVLQSFSPISGANVAQAITPWFARPVPELVQNRDFADRWIYQEAGAYDKTPPPASQRALPGTSEMAKGLAEWMNSATGGDAVRHGAVDVSPNVLEYLGAQLVGGAGLTTGRIYKVAEKIINGEPLPFRQIPVFNTLASEPSTYAGSKMYREAIIEAEKVDDLVKKGMALKPAEQKLAALVPQAKAAERMVTALKKLMKAKPEGAEREKVQAQIDAVQNRLAKQYAGVTQ